MNRSTTIASTVENASFQQVKTNFLKSPGAQADDRTSDIPKYTEQS